MKKSVLVMTAMLFIVSIFSQLGYSDAPSLPPPPLTPSIGGLNQNTAFNLTNVTLTNYTSNYTSNTTTTNQTQQPAAASNTTAALNAEIVALKQEIARLNETIASDKIEIARLNQEISNLKVITPVVEQPAQAKTSSTTYILIALNVILFLIVAGFVTTKIFKKHKLPAAANVPDHRTEILKQYMLLNRNVPLQSLKQELVNHGWPPEEIDRAAGEIGYV
jgi:hypothetical protein